MPLASSRDHAAGLLCYANVIRRSSGSFFISLRKADQWHDLASLVCALGYKPVVRAFVVLFERFSAKTACSSHGICASSYYFHSVCNATTTKDRV